MSRVFCKKLWKLNIFPYLIDFLPFLLQVLSLYVYAIQLKEFRHSMVLGKSNTKVSEKYCRAPIYVLCVCIVGHGYTTIAVVCAQEGVVERQKSQ